MEQLNIKHFHNKERRISVHFDPETLEKIGGPGAQWQRTGEYYSRKFLEDIGAIAKNPEASEPSASAAAPSVTPSAESRSEEKKATLTAAITACDADVVPQVLDKVIALRVERWGDPVSFDFSRNRRGGHTGTILTMLDAVDLNQLCAMHDEGKLDPGAFHSLLSERRRNAMHGIAAIRPKLKAGLRPVSFGDLLAKCGAEIASIQ